MTLFPAPAEIAEPPSIEDVQTAPTGADLLPQVLALTPRGQAWGADGVSPVMQSFWGAVASWVAVENARESEVFVQSFPSAVTFGLADWERELGLPPKGDDLMSSTGGRSAAVTIAARGLVVASPLAFIALAAAGGARIAIEEPEQFMVGSEVGPDADDPEAQEDPEAFDALADLDVWPFWILDVVDPGPFADAGEVLRALKPFAPAHTRLIAAAA